MKHHLLDHKKIISFFLVAAVLFGAFGIVGAAEEKSSRTYKANFRLAGYSTGGSEEFYYSDEYFMSPGTEISEHLRSLSAVLALAAITFSDEEYTAQGVSEMFTDMGFNPAQIDTKNMDNTTTESIGTIISHKNIDGVPLIAVAIRGNNYGQEWSSNLNLGEEGDPEGFSKAAAKVMARIDRYMESNSIGMAKFWVVGYSRAGSVANLVGRTLNENLDKYGTNVNDIYVYTFEAANSSADDTVYANIHNIANKNDFITYLYPKSWGIGLNGTREEIGDESSKITGKSFDISVENYVTDTFEIENSEFLNEFVEFFSEYITRESYVENLQPHLMQIVEFYFKKPVSDQNKILEYFSAVFESAMSDSGLVFVLLPVFSSPESDNSIDSTASYFKKHMGEVRKKTDVPITDSEYEILSDFVRPLMKVLSKMVKPELNYKVEHDGKTLKLPFFRLMTFAYNISALLEPHMNENFFARIKALDSYYRDSFSPPPGDIIYGKRYTYSELGEGLFEKAKELGFTFENIDFLRNGYDISIESEAKKLSVDEAPQGLYDSVDSVADKNAEIEGVYDVKLTKKIGFRTEEAILAYPDNRITITIGDDSDQMRSYKVFKKDGSSLSEVECECKHDKNGDVLTITAPKSGVYAITYTVRANALLSGDDSAFLVIIVFADFAVLFGIYLFVIYRRKKHLKRR